MGMVPSIGDFRLPPTRPMETRNFHITLKQWKMLHAIVDHGSFAEAAEKLHISQSAISYTVSKLQSQLGIPLLQINGRKAELTPAGRELLERSRHLIRDAIEIELFAEKLRQGWGSEIRLAATQSFPTHILLSALREFARMGNNTRISVTELEAQKAEEALCERTVDLAITSRVPFGFHGSPLIEIEHMLVAHPSSALFKLGREIFPRDLENYIELVIGDERSNAQQDENQQRGLTQKWHVSSFDTVLSTLCESIGYAWLPKHRIALYLKSGQLKALPFNGGGTYKNCLYLVYGRSKTSGSTLNTFAELLQRVAPESVDENRDLLRA